MMNIVTWMRGRCTNTMVRDYNEAAVRQANFENREGCDGRRDVDARFERQRAAEVFDDE